MIRVEKDSRYHDTGQNSDLPLLTSVLCMKTSGYHLAQIIREEDPLVLDHFSSVARKNEEDIITGLEMGGDYYITASFLPLTY